MAYTYILGFEMNSLTGEPSGGVPYNNVGGASFGSVSLETNASFVRTGSGSLKLTPASGAIGYYNPWSISSNTLSRPFYLRFYAKVTTLPASQRLLFGQTNVTELNVRVNASGTLQVYNNTTSLFTSATALTDTSKWYMIEIKSVSSPSALVELLIDGVSQGTNVNSAAAHFYFGANDTVAATYTIYIDDVAVNNSQYCGSGKAVLLKPISDNFRALLWTGGAGDTTNLWNAVNNTPPIGTATETNLTQIEHAGGAVSAFDAYDANMTAYSTEGIVTTDIINGVMPFIWHGEDVSTGTKLLSFNIESNPVTTNTGSIDAGVTALGTWPTGWYQSTGPLGGAPSNLDSPVMHVLRPETASRVASVCFMGIYVDYTPAVVVEIPNKFIQGNQAVSQAANW